MAQLIKLKDYVSRYEWNAYRYPSQYIRLKQENWETLYNSWINTDLVDEETEEEMEQTPFRKFKSFFKKDESLDDKQKDHIEEWLPTTEQQLRHYFLDKLYPFQLKWATSTVTDVSFMDQTFNDDPTLKYFLQRFPDIYLVMYYPIFNLKNAPVDGEIIFISPLNIEIIYLLEQDPSSIIMASDERTWTVETNHVQTKTLSPLIALRRTEQIVKSLLKTNNIEFPITKTVLSRTNDIVFSSAPYNSNIIGKRQYKTWFENKRKLSSPLKNIQLKVIETLLKHCLSTSVRRPEWEDDQPFLVSQKDI